MSNILSQIASSGRPTGIRAVIAGVEKIGKTTMVAGSPRRLFIPLEVGFLSNMPNKTPMLQSYDDFNGLLDEIIAGCQKGTFPYQTLAIDSATALERFIHEKVLQTDPLWKNGNPKGLIMDNALGGYGKAYNLANELFGKILAKLDLLAINAALNIVFTAHVFSGKVIDTTCGEYDTWDLLLHSPKNSKTYGKREMLCQWADLIGFLHEPLYISKQENVTMGINANKGRILGVERTPGYVAGNRFGMCGEISIPPIQSWNYLADAIYRASGIDIYNKD